MIRGPTLPIAFDLWGVAITKEVSPWGRQVPPYAFKLTPRGIRDRIDTKKTGDAELQWLIGKALLLLDNF